MTNIPRLNPIAYTGVEALTPPQFEAHPRFPTSHDYKSYVIGTMWLDVHGLTLFPKMVPDVKDIYILTNKKNGVATWVNFGALSTLTGDIGGPVSGDVNNNISLLGVAGHILTTGIPGIHEIAFDLASTISEQFTTDLGIAIPALNNLNILGGGDIDTSGALDSVTVSVAASVADQFTTDLGIAVPAANNLNILGGADINTSGALDTVTISITPVIPDQFTADVGTAVPVANNLNVLGGVGLITTAAADTITVSFAGEVPFQFTTDAGVATPALNNLNVVGDGVIIDTTGGGSTITVSGLDTLPSYAFSASQLGDIPNVTGNSTLYQIIFDNEYFDIGGNYNSVTGIYTTPVNGIYFFTVTVTYYNLPANGATPGSCNGILIPFGALYQLQQNRWVNNADNEGTFKYTMNFLMSYNAATNVSIQVNYRLATNLQTAGIRGGTAADPRTVFSGFLVKAT